jgi:hypothetical protein
MAFGSFSFLTQALTLRKYMQETLLDGPSISPIGTRQIRENVDLFRLIFIKFVNKTVSSKVKFLLLER